MFFLKFYVMKSIFLVMKFFLIAKNIKMFAIFMNEQDYPNLLRYRGSACLRDTLTSSNIRIKGWQVHLPHVIRLYVLFYTPQIFVSRLIWLLLPKRQWIKASQYYALTFWTKFYLTAESDFINEHIRYVFFLL